MTIYTVYFTPSFSWDTDMDAPTGVSTTGTLGGNSFSANVTGVAPNKYAAFRFVPQAIGFSPGATTNDITGFTYDTKKLGSEGYDWRVSLYTVIQDGQGSGWYGSRISYGYNGAAHDWATTDVFAEGAYRVAAPGVDVYSGDAGFAAALTTALGQSIMWIDIIAGADTPHPAVDAYLDNIQMTGTGGVDAQVDLVPEPATMSLLALGGIGLIRRRRKA